MYPCCMHDMTTYSDDIHCAVFCAHEYTCVLILLGSWTVDAMSMAIESQPSIVRKHMGFWASQGVLKEHPLDTFTVIEQQEESKHTQG